MGKELLFSVTKKDLDITWFSGTGAGGQHRNRHKNCCRIRHPESGVTVTGQEERSADRNLKTAFTRLTEHPKFKIWMSQKTHELTKDKAAEEAAIMKKVDAAMAEENIKIEYYDPEQG